MSGGPDSVALLRLLLELRKELGIVLSVVHVNHKLRGSESDTDAEFVSDLAGAHKLPLHSTVADVAQHAVRTKISIETAAREVRYQFFAELLSAGRKGAAGLNKIATGHTLDDQAETVLMRLIRGTGMRGLRAIRPWIHTGGEHGTAEIVRPLLQVRRRELQAYLLEIGQSWREDASNGDPKFTRNRVRQRLMPLLESDFNPAVAERLAELAEIARGEEEFWENEAEGWLGTGIQLVRPENAATPLVQLAPIGGSPGLANVLVDLAWLLSEDTAVQRRIIKAAADTAGLSLNFQHVDDILRLVEGEANEAKEVVLPGGWQAACDEDALEFLPPRTTVSAADYEFCLTLPGEVTISQIGSRIQAVQLASGELPASADPEHLFDAALLGPSVQVRNWRPGDRFWPAHTKASRKIKELLQAHHVPQRDRQQWPIVLSGDEVIWMRGFPGRAHMRPPKGHAAILIREHPLNERS